MSKYSIFLSIGQIFFPKNISFILYFRSKPVDHKSKLVYNSADFPNGLLAPPPYCERWVRQRKIHFALPYDIWWQHQYNQPVPSWNYRKIRTSMFFFSFMHNLIITVVLFKQISFQMYISMLNLHQMDVKVNLAIVNLLLNVKMIASID